MEKSFWMGEAITAWEGEGKAPKEDGPRFRRRQEVEELGMDSFSAESRKEIVKIQLTYLESLFEQHMGMALSLWLSGRHGGRRKVDSNLGLDGVSKVPADMGR